MRSYHLQRSRAARFIAGHRLSAPFRNYQPSRLTPANRILSTRACFLHLVGISFQCPTRVSNVGIISMRSFLWLFNIAHISVQYWSRESFFTTLSGATEKTARGVDSEGKAAAAQDERSAVMKPCSMAYRVKSAPVCKFSSSMSFPLWNSTVFTEIFKILAISLRFRPSATSCRTSR
jgi:hypothetical protein